MSKSSEDEFPSELNQTVADFHAKLTAIEEDIVAPLKSAGQNRSEAVKDQTALEKASVDITSLFALNSLAWLWLKTQGLDPQETEVKSELDRVKRGVQRLKEIELSQTKHARVDQAAAKRFVRSGLWNAKRNKNGNNDKQNPPQKKTKQ